MMLVMVVVVMMMMMMVVVSKVLFINDTALYWSYGSMAILLIVYLFLSINRPSKAKRTYHIYNHTWILTPLPQWTSQIYFTYRYLKLPRYSQTVHGR